MLEAEMPETRVPGAAAPAMSPRELDAELRRLHGGPDAAALTRLHERAADMTTSPKEARFHLTHAWVYALVVGDGPRVADLETRLRALGGLQ